MILKLFKIIEDQQAKKKKNNLFYVNDKTLL